MSGQLVTTEVALWQELRKYLVTETEISESVITTAYADRDWPAPQKPVQAKC